MIKSKILVTLILLFSLGIIAFLAVYVRLNTLDSPTVLDYDPWWFFRHAKEIVENDYKIPKWDSLSYYPPGRPSEPYSGWSYTIALMYKSMTKFMPDITLVDVAKIAPLVLVGLTVIVAFFLGTTLSNYIGGLSLAFFAVFSPTFITLSTAGYVDSDVVVVFYMFLSVLSYFLLLKNINKKLKAIPFLIFAVLANLLFIFNWGGGWLPSILLLVAIPAFFAYKIFENMLYSRNLKFDWKHAWGETKTITIYLLIALLVLNVLGLFLGFSTMFHSLLGGLGFTGLAGEPLIVNISVAELQLINIFKDFSTIADRAGLLPTILTFFGLPLLIFYRFYKKQKISFQEIFIIIWALISFYLISTGVRFSLLFSIAASTAAAYFLGNFFTFMKGRNNNILTATAIGVFAVFIIIIVSTAIKTGDAAAGNRISQNWYNALDWLKTNADENSLVATWWDPGHIIAGYTGLKVHADGAHCGNCVPYNHNVRIRDMGRILSTANETESINILKKYTHLTDEQCNQAREKFGDKMPEDACNDVTEVYVLATSDLIGKYYWMSCFGNFDMVKWKAGERNPQKLCPQGKNFIQLSFVDFDNSGLPVYRNDQFGMIITLAQNGTDILAILNSPRLGVKNMFVSDAVYFQNGAERHSKVSTNNTLDAMVWIDPSFRSMLFMDKSVRDSTFTKMFFFDGKDLDKFELVYLNPEVKIYKAKI